MKQTQIINHLNRVFHKQTPAKPFKNTINKSKSIFVFGYSICTFETFNKENSLL